MKKLFRYTRITKAEKFANIVKAFFFCLFYICGIQLILNTLYPYSSRTDSYTSYRVPIIYSLFIGCIVAPLWEEFCYRYVPITLANKIGGALNIDILFPIVILSSALFGWGHGQGQESILRQGVMGMVFSWVYIKNGYSIKSSIALHSFWNLLCIIIGTG